MTKTRVMLVDDQTILRAGLKLLLETEDDIAVVGEAGDGGEAVKAALACKPDVILMDIRMPGMDGVSAAKQIKAELPETVIIMLTTFDDDEYIIKAMTYGASGYLLKDIESERLVRAIRDGINGNVILPGRISAKLAAHLSAGASARVSTDMFTDREIDIIRLLVQGKSNNEIADKLILTVGTVKNYISQIYMKLGVNDRTNAVSVLQQLNF